MFILKAFVLNTLFNKVFLKKFLFTLQFQCKRVLVYALIFTQIYSPAAYGGKLYFDISEETNSTLRKTNLGGKVESKNVSNKVVSRIRLKIWEANENKDPSNLNDEIYNHIVEFDTSNAFNPCKIPSIQPAFANPGIGCPFHKYFEHSGPNLKINHYDAKLHEQISFIVSQNGEIEIQRLLNPEREIFIKTFGNISTNIPQYKVKFLPMVPVFESLVPGELGVYLKGETLYCKTKEQKEIEIISADVPSDPSLTTSTYGLYKEAVNTKTLSLNSLMVERLRNTLRNNTISLEDQNALFKFAGFMGYTPKLRLLPAPPSSFSSLESRELGLYLRGNSLVCKTKEQKEIEVIEANAPSTRGIASDVLERLKKAVRENIEDQNTLLAFTGLCSYTPTLLRGQSLHLTAHTIGCYTPFLMDKELELTASDKLFNKSHLQASHLNLSVDTIKNSNKMIGSDRLNVNVKTLFDNAKDALVFAVQGCTFQGTGRLHNHKEAEIKSSGTLISSLPEVNNEGSIVADLSINFELNNLRNTELILSHKTLGIHARSTVTNHGFLEGRYEETSLTAQKFFNYKSLVSRNGPLLLNVERGENHFSIISQNSGGIHLTIGEFFKNLKELQSDDTIKIKGTGHLHNTKSGTIKADEQLKIKGVSVTNDGLLESIKKILASIPQLVQSGLMKASEASFNIKDLQNSGKILIEELLNLIVGRGSNDGHIQGNSFTFTVSNQFTNRQALDEKKPTLHGGKFFILEGEGSFINQHIVRAEDFLALKNKTFLNEDHVEAGGNLDLGGGINLTNAQRAKVLSKGSLKTTGATSLTNHRDGFISSQGDMILTHLLKFSNEGSFCSKGLLRLISQGDIMNFHHLIGELGMYLEAGGLMSNIGDIESKETIGIQAAQIVNHKTIQGPKAVTLKALQSFENHAGAEVNSTNGKVTLTSPQLTIQGPVKGKTVDVHHQGTMPFHGNVAATQTLTLHVPYGWSLENKAQAFGHSIVLHGPIRNPGNLNIKGDYFGIIQKDFLILLILL